MSHKFLNINWDLFDKKAAQDKEKLRQMLQQNSINGTTTNTNYNVNNK